MYFKKIEIFGFKSFADKTILNFEPGITAIVGPNGCGKSNIFDAIRWVLGEQSVKELRGSSMEDVIFNGTANKPSLGFAEVSLTFSNESRMLSIEYDEVTITRRLFRSGESEYLLNKTNVRLKDIQELLMGTGIGAEAYSLIQQGKVDLVVSARPEDRRLIFDEAAGITKYKSKKREALNKLRDTENNLLRVNDITIEVKRQIGSIERQANKARKYKVEFERLKELEVKLAGFQIKLYSEQKDKIHAHLQEFKQKEIELTEQLRECTDCLTKESYNLEELEKKINDIHTEEIKLDGQIDLNNRQVGFNQERLEHLRISDQKLIEHKEQLIERCRTQQEKIEETHQSIAVIEESLKYNEQTLGEKRNCLTVVEKSVREAKEKIKEHDEKIMNLTSNQVNVRNDLTDIMKNIQGALARKRRLEIENEKVSCEKQEQEQKLQNTEYQINSAQGIINELDLEKENKERIIMDLKTKLSQLDKHIDESGNKKLSLKSQKEFIEKLHAQYHDISDPIIEGRLITQSPPLDHHTGIIGKVKEVIPISPDYLKRLKGNFTQTDEKELYEIICETKFIELDPQQISIKINEISDEINAMTAQKESFIQNLQEQRESIRQIVQEIHTKEKSHSILQAQKKDILEETQKLSGELELVDLELTEVKESLEAIQKKEDELNYQLDTINQDIGWCQNDIKDKQAWIATQLQEKEATTVSIAQLETEIESEKDKFESLQENLEMFSKDLDNWLEEIKKIDDEVSEQGVKKERYQEEMEILRGKIEEIKTSKESLCGILNDYVAKKLEVIQKIDSVHTNIASLEEDIERIKQDVHAQQLNEQKITFDAQGIKDRLMQTYKINFDEILETSLNQRESQETMGVSATNSFEMQAGDQSMNPEELNQEIDRLKKRCDAFGNVNLVAIDEFEELKGRYEFLTKQQSDLLEAKSQLMNTINKINRSTHQMFMDTFSKVSEEFRVYFRMLFGGGDAQLVLLDPDNVLESGIEIIARPPGKKLQSISLLSGGEKTLTAIALIFGVFKVNPSPFCVLDEIDAALDDSNVDRFGILLKNFAKIAQFIIITHNKNTIANSDIMYGITMPETGVSRIVSVKFSEERDKQVREEVPVGA